MACRLLIVDDQLDVARTLARALKSRGFQANVAHTCAEALLQEGPIDCAIVDIDLPDGTGLELAPRLLLSNTESVVFFSGSSDADLAVEANRYGPFVAKSAGLDELVAQVNHAIELAAKGAESEVTLRSNTPKASGSYARIAAESQPVPAVSPRSAPPRSAPPRSVSSRSVPVSGIPESPKSPPKSRSGKH